MESNYKKAEGVSQSQLKALLVGVGVFNKVEDDDEKVHFLLGDAVDMWLTQGKEEFENSYYISTIKKPSDTIVKIVNRIFEGYPYDENPRDYFDALLEACNHYEYQSNWKDETKINKISLEGQDYWNELIEADGRPIIDVEQYSIVKSIVNTLTTHEFTKDIFDTQDKVYGQLAIYFNYTDIECKALLDRVHVNHKNKTIQPYDLKTTGDFVTNFKKSAKRFRYDIQASWYTLALEHWKTYNYPDYTILPFKFIVASTKYLDSYPLVYTCSKEELLSGQFGVTIPSTVFVGNEEIQSFKTYKGFEDALDLYLWHKENNFEVEKEVALNKGNLQLNLWK